MDEALQELRVEIAKLDKEDPALKWITTGATDLDLKRFLAGHGLKVKDALQLMLKCSKWRHEYRTDELISKYEPTAAEDLTLEIRFARAYLPLGIIGHDAENRPIMLQRLSAVDFPRIIAELGLDKAIEYSIYLQEKLMVECIKQNAKKPGECILILDFGQEDMANPPITTLMEARAWVQGLLSFLKPFAAIVDPYYPEMFHRIMFTRTPSMFAAAWSVAKHFVAENTREKIEILTNKTCTKRLLELLPARTVPAFLGGENAVHGLGKGGKLAKNVRVAHDLQFVEQLELDLIKDKASRPRKSVVEAEQDNGDIAARVAVDLLRAALVASNNNTVVVLPDDVELERVLREHDYDQLKALTALLT